MKIFLDDQGKDVRASWVPEGWVVTTTVQAFKECIENALRDRELIEAIDFDNDLGEEVEGVHLVKWLQEVHPEIIEMNPLIELKVHSQNPVAREELRVQLDILQRHYKELMEAKITPHPFGELKVR